MNGANPFIRCRHPIFGWAYEELTVDGRIQMARQFNRKQCLQAMRLASLSPKVCSAIAKRLRSLPPEPEL